MGGNQRGPTSGAAAPDAACNPFVTIAIPTFNRAHLLVNCLRHALAQTYSHFEILVSDNASSDRTAELLSQFDDPRLRVIRQPFNIGLLPNWNACLAEAKGDYIMVVSDDDSMMPHSLELCIRTMTRPDLPIVVALSNIQLTTLHQTRHARKSRVLTTGIHDGHAILREFLRDHITVTTCSVLIRTDLLRMSGGFPPDLPYAADVASWAPLLLRGPAGFVNEACATFNLHDMSETSRLSIEMRLQDCVKANEIIGRAIDQLVVSPWRRWTLRRQSNKCFARRNLLVLSDYLRSSGRPLQAASLLWKFRSYVWAADFLAVVRFAAILLCPSPVADRLRRMRRTAAA